MSENDTLGRLMEAVARIEARVEGLATTDAAMVTRIAELDSRVRLLEMHYVRAEASYKTIIALLSVCGVGTVAQLVQLAQTFLSHAN